ncbi:hypothetical protein BD408DRAFT_485392 [Parasitella parasitica]|nr:hypothetical protein BD408DRAFT_485392 [Parasitella parasitica]
MSHLYWNTPLLSSLVATHNMPNNKNLKRTRSTESLENAFKRSKPFHDSPASVSSEPTLLASARPLSPSSQLVHTTAPAANSLYPTNTSTSPLASIKSISISTKTESNIPLTPHPDYSRVNGMLHNLHVLRFGDPEARESWWEDQDQDMDMEEISDEYSAANSILRQAFLKRRLG